MQSAPTDTEIKDACATLSRNAKDTKALGVIQAAAVEDALPPAMRSRAMVLCALPFLQQMNTNQFGRITQVLLSTYPEEGPAALGLTESDWLAACPSCNGVGAKVVACPPCSGSGICPTCQGMKKTSAGAVCPACKGDGKCARCEGTKEIRNACLECRGSGKVVVISPNIARRYEAVLSELRALASENIQFAEQSKKALAMWNVLERLAALEEVIAAFPNRQDMGPLVKARDVAQAEIDEKAAKEQVRAEQTRIRQERDALYAAAEKLPFSSVPVLVRQIDDFLAKYPQSEYRIELEVLKSKQQTRHTVYTNVWRGLYILGGLIAVLFVVQVVKDWIQRRTRKESLLKIPGMENMDADELTDPLSDSRKAAAAREADDDLGIYP
ncbi:MAG: hypothetical protein FWH21_03280 [Kiritimatiellaeota bacterium]|nr:hypothetical protein [Kiritimatiellota bacterium]